LVRSLLPDRPVFFITAGRVAEAKRRRWTKLIWLSPAAARRRRLVNE